MQDFTNTSPKNIKVKDLETGRQMRDEVLEQLQATFAKMQEAGAQGDNDTYRRLMDRHYNLKKVKQAIQNQMGNLIKQRHNQGGNYARATEST